MASLMASVQSSSLVRATATIRRQAVFAPAAPLAAKPSPATVSDLVASQRYEASRASIVAFAKKGGKGGKGGGRDDSDDEAPAAKKGGGGKGEVDLVKVEKEAKADAEDRMKKTLGALGDQFNTIRTGRANASILDRIMVDQFGVPTPLKGVAQVSVPDASTLLISPFDRSALKEIEKALLESDIGINPSNDGEKIRLNVPPLTQERRKELAKFVAKFSEEGKVSLRNVRQDVLKKISKVEFAKDTKKDLEDAIQKLTDANVKKVDEMAKAKTDEVMKL